MSIEELAARIQDGEKQLYGELWEQIRRLVVYIAKRRLPSDGSTNKIELEDLIQDGYLAMVKAVEAYDRESGYAFITYMTLHLKSVFAEELGYRSSRRDALRSADSLDRPLPGDNNGFSLMSAIPDTDAEREISDIDDLLTARSDYEQLMKEVDKLDGKAQDIIQRHYVSNQSLSAIGEAHRMTADQVRRYESRVFLNLRHRGAVRRMAENYADRRANAYQKKSLTAFNSSRSSVVEDIAEHREYLTKEYLSRYKPDITGHRV